MKGFTLLEILVSMVIFSVTMMTLFSSARTFLHSADQVKIELSVNDHFASGLHIIGSDLAQVFVLQPPRYRKPFFGDDPDIYRFTATQESIDGIRFSRLEFASTHHLQIGHDSRYGVARITYYVHQKGEEFNLHRSDRLFPYDTEISPCTDPILIKHIQEFTLTFVDREEEEYDTWNSDDKAFEFTFPSRVAVAIKLATEPSRKHIMTSMALPVTRMVTP